MSKYKIVPVAATTEMLCALGGGGFLTLTDYGQLGKDYKAMLAAAPSVNPWVSVKTRLPEKHGFYLCLDSEELLGETFFKNDMFMTDVTHWWDEEIMPIPRPDNAAAR